MDGAGSQLASPHEMPVGYARSRMFAAAAALAAVGVTFLVLVFASSGGSSTHAMYGLFGGLTTVAAWAVFRLGANPVLILTDEGLTAVAPTAPKEKRRVTARWEDITGLILRSGYRRGPTLCIYAKRVTGDPPLPPADDVPGAITMAAVSLRMLPRGLDLVEEMKGRATRRGVNLPGVLKRGDHLRAP